ncbi:hypothetical protein BUALT_Bualt06G0026100 [Buddleja alternifolia]|uniref:Uricase n=1 Tax=Buddleja alternifolia TaxID=168488 RepID=A0AAV6XK37_9LAMI|nr:hypothetical protein BUALT_Bualt06G0026100 [Buddleja alternifolia]
MITDGLRLEQRHGKARMRVGRVWREPNGGRHRLVEWNVNVSLLSHCLPAYTHADNSDIVATDTIKNIVLVSFSSSSSFLFFIVYAKAKECDQPLSMEDFAIVLAKHFTSSYEQVSGAIINIVEKPWERIYLDGQPHEHGFKLGSEKHTTEVIINKCGAVEVISGVEGLVVLKTTQSGFEGFPRDSYTTLPETRERVLGTEITASWRYTFETLTSIPERQFYFMGRYMDVKKVLIDTYFGPAKGGAYSSSVQSTLYHMANSVLARSPLVQLI